MTRVLKPGLSSLDTPVAEVMTRNPHVAPLEMEAGEAFEFMTEKNFRHLPIADRNGKLAGMLSVRHLMRAIVDNLAHELESLNAYVSVDGAGGD
jgi:CBS domain-containing protein